jgi:hypothetical protein
MFTISTFDEPVSIVSLDLYTAITAVITVQVYTKHGVYKGYEADDAAWHKITDTTMWGGGQGSITQIPESAFNTVHMLPNQTRRLYVTTTTPVLQHSRTIVELGQVFVTTEFLQNNTGAGMADPLFGKSLCKPRVFNRAIQFRHTNNCIATLNITVTFIFNVQQVTSLTPSEVSETTSKIIKLTWDAIISQ